MMGSIERFEDLIAWQKARVLAAEIYRTTRQGDFSRDFGLTGQMQRAAVSIMSNIAEGYERGSTAEFERFLWMAKGSCAELRSQLYVARDIGYLGIPDSERLMAMADEVGRVLGGLRASVARRRNGQR
jgi:four helix bundle protein